MANYREIMESARRAPEGAGERVVVLHADERENPIEGIDERALVRQAIADFLDAHYEDGRGVMAASTLATSIGLCWALRVSPAWVAAVADESGAPRLGNAIAIDRSCAEKILRELVDVEDEAS